MLLSVVLSHEAWAQACEAPKAWECDERHPEEIVDRERKRNEVRGGGGGVEVGFGNEVDRSYRTVDPDQNDRLRDACLKAARHPDDEDSCATYDRLFDDYVGASPRPPRKVNPVLINCTGGDVALHDDDGRELRTDPRGRFPLQMTTGVTYRFTFNAKQITTFGPQAGTTYYAWLEQRPEAWTFVLGAWLGEWATDCRDLYRGRVPEATRISLELAVSPPLGR